MPKNHTGYKILGFARSPGMFQSTILQSAILQSTILGSVALAKCTAIVSCENILVSAIRKIYFANSLNGQSASLKKMSHEVKKPASTRYRSLKPVFLPRDSFFYKLAD